MKKYFLSLLALIILTNISLAQAPPSTDIYVYDLKEKKANITLSKGENITKREGYDNQPSFYRNDFLLYSSYRNGQTDIFVKDLYEGKEMNLTNSNESEYSPQIIPGYDTFGAVRQDAEGRQQLWLYHMDGKSKPEVIIPKVEPIGYFAWNSKNDILAFVLGDPITLVDANAQEVYDQAVTSNVGRTIKNLPESDDFAFERTEETGEIVIYTYSPTTGEFQKLIEKPENAMDWCITKDGTYITSVGTVLYTYNPDRNETWQKGQDLGNVAKNGITRMAVNQDNKKIAIVINN